MAALGLEMPDVLEVAQTLEGRGKWGSFVVQTIVLLVIVSTISFALSTMDSLHDQYHPLFTGIEYFCQMVFTIEYVLRLWVAQNKSNLFNYALQPLALIDLFSILPSWVDLFVPGDAFPALQFLRMMRLFKFLSASERGSRAIAAFQQSFSENKQLIVAASFAGAAVWLVTASLLYYAERNNEEMLWCYPPPERASVSGNFIADWDWGRRLAEVSDGETDGGEADGLEGGGSEEDTEAECVCHGEEGCEGSGCICHPRFGSIPSSMFFVLLNLSGDFPLAEKHSTLGRFVIVATAFLSVGIFAIPTGLIGASLEGAISALHIAEEEKEELASLAGHTEEDDLRSHSHASHGEQYRHSSNNNGSSNNINRSSSTHASNVGEHHHSLHHHTTQIPVPEYTESQFYKNLSAVLISLSVVTSIMSTVKSIKGDETVKRIIFVVDMASAIVFCLEHISRIVHAGPKLTCETMFHSFLPLSDLGSWLPTMLYALGGATDCPSFILLTVALFRMIKFERYTQGFLIIGRVIEKSQGVLAVGGMAAACCLIFCSTLMYYSERNNPDPRMRQYYDSVPTAMWITLLNLSGEVPLCDYTLLGRFIVGMLCIVAVAIFAIPIGVLGSGFEEVVEELMEEKEENEEEHRRQQLQQQQLGTGRRDGSLRSLLDVPSSEVDEVLDPLSKVVRTLLKKGANVKDYGAMDFGTDLESDGMNGSSSASAGGISAAVSTTTRYHSISVSEPTAASSSGTNNNSSSSSSSNSSSSSSSTPSNCVSAMAQRLADGQGMFGRMFQTISVFATLFAVTLEIVGTCDFAQTSEQGTWIIFNLEAAVVVWFTIEYAIRTIGQGYTYMSSALGLVDLVSTFPWYMARGVFGDAIAGITNHYDGPLRALRLLRLVRLDTYAPSLSLVGQAFKGCWPGLSVACYAGVVLWFLFNECLYFAEHNDAEDLGDHRFRSALSSLQYSALILTGDYPEVEFSGVGKIIRVVATVVVVGIVDVPASVLAGAFVDILQKQAEARRLERYAAAMCIQRFMKRFFSGSSKNKIEKPDLPTVVQAAINRNTIHTHKSDPSSLPILARIALWKSGKAAETYNNVFGILISLNILSVVLESMPIIENSVPHIFWQVFESFSVLFFTFEYLLNCLTAAYDPKWGFSRWKMMTSFIGMADLIAILPFYIEMIVVPILVQHDGETAFDATIFRIFRLARILEYERFFTAFSLLDDVFIKAAPVLKATGVLALIVWVGAATIFYYAEPHNNHDQYGAEQAAAGGEEAAVFVSIADSLYYVAIFLAGDWARVDYSPLGSLTCTVMAIVGVALFSIPVGVLFESFQEMLREQHATAIHKHND